MAARVPLVALREVVVVVDGGAGAVGCAAGGCGGGRGWRLAAVLMRGVWRPINAIVVACTHTHAHTVSPHAPVARVPRAHITHANRQHAGGGGCMAVGLLSPRAHHACKARSRPSSPQRRRDQSRGRPRRCDCPRPLSVEIFTKMYF